MPSWPRTCNWIFLWRQKIFKSSGVPIRLLTQKNSLCQIVRNIMKNLHASFEWFSQTGLSARMNFVNFSLKKNLTSNRSKPIRVLTRTKSSCSDERLPIGYSIRNFQPNQSNFLNRFSSVHFTSVVPGRKGVDTGVIGHIANYHEVIESWCEFLFKSFRKNFSFIEHMTLFLILVSFENL